jgi:hypothetical protein
MDTLTTTEASRLQRHKTTIRKGLATFVEVGTALKDIRDAKLYRQSHDTFEAFCNAEFAMSRQHAYRFIEGAETVKALPENVTKLVTNLGTAREVAKLPEEQRAEVLEKAKEQGKVTAASVAKATKADTVHDVDQTGEVIPKPLMELWNRAASIKDTLEQLRRCRLAVVKALEASDPCFAEVDKNVMARMESVESDLDRVLPYAVCPTCSGRHADKCKLCKGRGFISEFAWRTFVPKEVRDMRAAVNRKQ